MLDKSITDLINDQINKEMYSSYLYLAISNYYKKEGLEGFSKWFKKQAEEELEHAMKFNSYLYEENEEVSLSEIAAPKVEFKDYREPLVAALEHEKFITASINKIYFEATKLNDYRTILFLNWFITEQKEEEENATELVVKYDLATKASSAYLLDKEIGESRE